VAEPEPVRRTPDALPPGTNSWEGGHPFDVRAVEGTDSYPVNPTATFYGPAAGANQPPTVSSDVIEVIQAVDLPRIPGFRMLRVIAQGGMGTVFEAIHIATDRVVALKVINAGWANNNDFRARFEREVKTLAALKHENIVPIYDAGSWQGLPFLTMEFVACRTLSHHLPALRRDLPRACWVLVQVARAVHYLHGNGIVHRDLKPLNILISPGGKPLVADFGLVRPMDDDSELSLTHVPLGTRQYMSPEQTRGGRENYTPACDIWALGVILYELLAGARPFEHEDTVELFHRIRTELPRPIPPDANAPPGLVAIALRCMQKAPADRYATAADLARDLERWRAGEVIPLPPPPAPPAKSEVAPAVAVVAPPALAPRRRVRWVIAVAALCALLGFSGVPPKEATPPKQEPVRTINERLQAGEVVYIVGEKGLPRVGYRTLPGTHGVPTTECEGHLTLNSAGMAAIEFDTGPLPPAYQLEGEIAVVGDRNDLSAAGFFAGRKETDSEQGKQQTAVFLIQTNRFQEENQPRMTETVFLELHRWVDTPFKDRTSVQSKRRDVQLAPEEGKRELIWNTFSLVVELGRIAANWRHESVGAIANDVALKNFNGFYRLSHRKSTPPFHSPVFGPGFGLTVNNATAVFKNVRIVPLNLPAN
jgi:eukaryotic-like serine/threonine-protein kinase